MSKVRLFKSSRPGELAELVTEAGSSGEGGGEDVATGSTGATAGGGREGEPRLGSLDDYDGIITVGGDGTLHEVFLLVRPGRNDGFKGLPLAGAWQSVLELYECTWCNLEPIRFNTCR